MKRTLTAILAALCFAGCMRSRQQPDDRSLAFLQGPVVQVAPSAAGQMMRFDTLGRITYCAYVDEHLAPTGEQTSFIYGTLEDGRTERIEIISRNGQMVDRRRCAVSFDGKKITMQYFKRKISDGKRVFTPDKRIVKIRGLHVVEIKEPNGETAKFRYDRSRTLPSRMRIIRNDGTVSITKFEYPQIDSCGNWLTRLSIKDDSSMILESRMIKYSK